MEITNNAFTNGVFFLLILGITYHYIKNKKYQLAIAFAILAILYAIYFYREWLQWKQ